MTTTSNEKKYFDLLTEGRGYIQHVREVPVRGGRRAQPFLACTIAALIGPAKKPGYRYFDVRVCGADAKKLVERYIGVDDRKQRPLVRFHISDLWGDPYIRNAGPRTGEPDANLKGRLLKAELIDRSELASISEHELLTRGIGYLSRPKDVTPKDGEPFLSCSISALVGPVTLEKGEKREYRYFNTVVGSAEAEELVRRCVQAVEADHKVLIGFRLNDIKADAYIRTRGDHVGQPAAILESTLVHIGLIKIDGVQVHPRPQAHTDASAANDAITAEAQEATDPPSQPAETEPVGEVAEQENELAAAF